MEAMNTKSYVAAIVKKIHCDKTRKEEIAKQLSAEIEVRLEQGEKQEEIISQMGTIQEIADSFNETISEKEKKRYRRNKIGKWVLLAAIVLILFFMLLLWTIPKSYDIAQSDYFKKEQVEEAMHQTVECLDLEDYKTLQANATAQMQEILTADKMKQVKEKMAEDWGERIQFGTVYMAELVQKNTHYAVGEITVSYENITVTYRLTYDTQMRLAGLYIR